MYVSSDARAAFVHIPKTGGTAIKIGLLRTLNCRRVGHRHGTIKDLPEDCEHYFVFTIVRDPYRRLASQYRFRRIRDQKGGLFARTFPTLDAYLAGPATATAVRPGKHPIRQLDYLDDRVTWFRFENFDGAIRAICAALDIPVPALPIGPHANRFGHYSWRDEITARAVEIINDECRDDFEAFGYPMLTFSEIMKER